MPKRKIDDSRLEEFVSFMKERDIYLGREYYRNGRKELKEKFDISKSLTWVYINKLIEKKLLTKEERSAWAKDYTLRRLRMNHERYGSVVFSQMMSDARAMGIGSDSKKLVSAARAGGLSTQKKHKHVKDNLKNARMYSPGTYYYGPLEFDSKGERLIGVVLEEYELLHLEEGVTFKKNFGRKEVDFYINDKLVVEYHPLPKKHSEIDNTTENKYRKERLQDISDYFCGKIVVLTRPSAEHFYNKAKKLGIKDSYSGVLSKFKTAKEKIADFETFMGTIDDKIPEEDVI
jgi:hypothetical protein